MLSRCWIGNLRELRGVAVQRWNGIEEADLGTNFAPARVCLNRVLALRLFPGIFCPAPIVDMKSGPRHDLTGRNVHIL